MTRDEYLLELGRQYDKLTPEQLAIYDKNFRRGGRIKTSINRTCEEW